MSCCAVLDCANTYIVSVTVIDKVLLNILFVVVYTCKKCDELNYLSPTAFWNITDFIYKCPKCNAINTITLENGELKKHS
jgi:phage FluMu protein Com